MSNQTAATLREDFRASLDLRPMHEAPKEGTSFTAILLSGHRTLCERMDADFATPSDILPASSFVGWLIGSEEKPDPDFLSERQARAEYEAEAERYEEAE